MTHDELRKLAEAATPGPWTIHFGLEGDVLVKRHGIYVNVAAAHDKPKANAAYIAAANPQTVLGLLDRIAALEELNGLAREYDAADDDAFWEPPHPIFEMAEVMDILRKRHAALVEVLRELGKGWRKFGEENPAHVAWLSCADELDALLREHGESDR